MNAFIPQIIPLQQGTFYWARRSYVKRNQLNLADVTRMISLFQSKTDKEEQGAIHPAGPFMRRWDMFMMLLLVYTAIITPYEVAFLNLKVDWLFICNRFVDFAFLVDIGLNFFLAFYDEDAAKLEFGLVNIRKRYLKGWFPMDAISVLPFDLLGMGLESRYVESLRVFRFIRLLRLTKLLRVVRASRILTRWQSEFGIRYSVISLLKFGLALVSISHWGACLWALVPSLTEADESWLHGLRLNDSGHLEKYVAALYWSSMTVTTIGYGGWYKH
jgi:hypothetical protein